VSTLLPSTDLSRLLVVSPHFDDAVLSCAHLLDAAAVAIVVTVFGGSPTRRPLRVTSWDRRCGFTVDDDVVAVRRAENQQATAELGVEAFDLDLVDAQYRRRACHADDVATALAPAVAAWRPTTVALPLGIGHSDHRLAAEGALRLTDGGGSDRLAYAELPYAWRTPDLVAQRVSRLRARYGLVPLPVAGRLPSLKAKALAAYGSQLCALRLDGALDELAEQPEQLWHIAPGASRLQRMGRMSAGALERRGIPRGARRLLRIRTGR
jgi:LmbE family N-acetylglucosaminyl deacetylase